MMKVERNSFGNVRRPRDDGWGNTAGLNGLGKVLGLQ